VSSSCARVDATRVLRVDSKEARGSAPRSSSSATRAAWRAVLPGALRVASRRANTASRGRSRREARPRPTTTPIDARSSRDRPETAETNATNDARPTLTGASARPAVPFLPDSVPKFFQAVGIGLTVAFGGLVFAVSFAALVFDGPEAPAGALAAGASFALWGGAVTALIIACRSSLPAIAEVQDGPSAIFASMAAAIYGTEGIEESAKLPTLEACVVIVTATTGALMALLGQYKLGNIVRVLPSPVTGGFLAGTGWVLTSGACAVLSGNADALSWETVLTFLETFGGNVSARDAERFAFVGGPGIALGIALAVGNRRIGQFWVVPSFLSGFVAFYFAALRGFFRVEPSEALTRGYLLGPFPELDSERRFGFVLDSSLGDVAASPPAGLSRGVFGTSFDPILSRPEIWFSGDVRWDVVSDQVPGATAVFGLSALGVLLITSAVEMSTERDGDANEELRAAGLANILAGLGGGLVGYHSLSSTQIAHGMGNASRVPGITASAAYVGALVVGPAPLAYVPSALIGGLLLFIGISFLYEWVVEGRDRLPRSEYAVVVLIVVAVASRGYVAGVAAGVLGAAAVFVSDYSKVPVVRSRLRLGRVGGVRSSAPRSRKELDVLARRGRRTYGAKLQGFLFFATAYTVLEEIRAAHEDAEAIGFESESESEFESDSEFEFESESEFESDSGGLSHVVLDFASVVGADGSAISVFEKLRRWAKREGIVLVLSDCDAPALTRVLDITLRGEAKPTFGLVDRANVLSNGDSRDDRLERLKEEVGDGLKASDGFGNVVQTTDLDAALRFTEHALLASEREEENAGTAIGAVPGRTVSSLHPKRSRFSDDLDDLDDLDDDDDDDDHLDLDDTDSSANRFVDFDSVCASVCETEEEVSAFRNAWVPVRFEAGAVVCERGEAADRIYWIENAVVVVETGGRVTESDAPRATVDATSALESIRETPPSSSSSPESAFGSIVGGSNPARESRASSGESGGWKPRRTGSARESSSAVDLGSVAAGSTRDASSVSELDPSSTTSDQAAAIANANRASYGISVTRDFMGAVGFYRRGGAGNVRFGRIVVREPGEGYCLTAEALEGVEETHPRVAVRLHKVMAGTLANQVVSRNKLITQFVK